MAPILRKTRAVGPIRKSSQNQNKKKKISSMKISDLNEHCLLELFRNLSPVDMCAVRDTCVRFRDVAETHMSKLLQSKELILDNQDGNEYKVFVKFGGLLKKLNVGCENWPKHNKEIFLVIRKLHPNLESLTLADADFELALSRLRPLLGTLRKIKLEYCDNDFCCNIRREETIRAICRACTNIKELSFGAKDRAFGSCYQGIFLQQKFKHLRSLELYEVRDLDLNNLIIFLKSNPNVQRLSLKRCVSLSQLSRSNLIQFATNIEILSIEFNVSDHLLYKNKYLPILNDLLQLEKLKCVALDTCNADVRNFIASMAKGSSIICLSLTNVYMKVNEGLGDAFANMQNIKILRLHIAFYGKFGQELFQILCKNLVNLEELHLPECNVDLQQIGDIIENSINLKKLFLYLPSSPLSMFVLDDNRYLTYVQMQSRKEVTFPLKMFFPDSFTFPVGWLLESTLRSHQNVINVLMFKPSDVDDF